MKNILLAFCFVFSLSQAFSQDLIKLKSGEILTTSIVEVTNQSVFYKLFPSPDSSIYQKSVQEISIITYQNGSVTDFRSTWNKQPGLESEALKVDTTINYFVKGQVDASNNYSITNGATAGVLVTSLLSPLAGLIPAIACSSTMPNKQNLHYPDKNLIQNPEYYLGYSQRAKKIKQKQVWTYWGICFGINLAAVIVFSTSVAR